ncbi:NAD(P)-binding domain-containing protein [Pontibacter sp. G13]|uniref:NADPH-dependent F420 reductase n=1 Tax=Pontibacter sp. G13 TaxID=3074898 RepID=UPI00288A715C|nr:NAD(P)-binding domain-containing protein [Pontibacter sp. G13]WNJ16651.1 NAD(P)-binding domain-containing protein [Pontibacter sp. G13]
MKIAVLGSGNVGQTIGSRLIELGYEVVMGTRNIQNEKAQHWVAQHTAQVASHTIFETAAQQAENIVFNCTNGSHTLEALHMTTAEALAGKILVDLSNSLDFSQGMPPTLLVQNKDSLGEQIQREFPEARVIKSLNTLNAKLMLNPRNLNESHMVFLSGNEPAAKTQFGILLQKAGWEPHEIVDLGDISSSRGPEMFLPLWLRIYQSIGTADFNIKIVKS